MDSHFESTIIFALICTMLIGLLLLIYHTDNPFEVGPDSFADDDLETLVNLDSIFDVQDAEIAGKTKE